MLASEAAVRANPSRSKGALRSSRWLGTKAKASAAPAAPSGRLRKKIQRHEA